MFFFSVSSFVSILFLAWSLHQKSIGLPCTSGRWEEITPISSSSRSPSGAHSGGDWRVAIKLLNAVADRIIPSCICIFISPSAFYCNGFCLLLNGVDGMYPACLSVYSLSCQNPTHKFCPDKFYKHFKHDPFILLSLYPLIPSFVLNFICWNWMNEVMNEVFQEKNTLFIVCLFLNNNVSLSSSNEECGIT